MLIAEIQDILHIRFLVETTSVSRKVNMPGISDNSPRRFPSDALTLTFTGHRPNKLAGYDRAAYKPFTNQLADILFENYYKNGYRRFITGGAQGFDQLAFWAVEKMKRAYKIDDVENVLYIPFAGQDRIWKENGTFSQEDYRKMRQFADREVILIPHAMTKGEIVAALMGRNREMVNASDRVLALCNSSNWQNDKGGTAACMQYAQHKKVPIDRVKTAFGEDGTLRIAALERDIA